MQGQRSAIGSLPDSINFDYGSSSTNVGIDQQICWNNLRNPAESRLPDYRISTSNSSDSYMGTVTPEEQNLRRWNIGESSSSSTQNLVCLDERMTPSGGWSSSSMNASSTGSGLRLEDHRYEPSNLASSQAGVNLNLSSHQTLNGSAFVRSSSSSSIPQNLDLDEAHFHRVGEDMDCPNNNNSKAVGFESKFISAGSSSSDPFASSSGSGGYLVEDDNGRPGCSLDGRRLSCKRKTLEGNVGQSSNSSGSCFPREEGSSMWHAVPPHYVANNANIPPQPENSSINPSEHVNPRLGLSMSSADSLRALAVRGVADSSHRNYRLRMNPSIQQDSVSNNSLLPTLASGSMQPETPAVHQPLRFVHPPIDLMAPFPPENSAPPPQTQSVVLRVPNLRRNTQALRWNGVPNLRPGSSSNATSVERETAISEDLNNPRSMQRNNIAEHPMFVPPVEVRSSTQNPTNWNLGGVSNTTNANLSRNLASSSRTGNGSSSGSGSGSHSPPGPSWASHRHSQSQYSRRLSEYVRRSLLSAPEIPGQSTNNNGQHRSGPAVPQEGVLGTGSGGNPGHSQPYSRSALWLHRQADSAVGVPYSLRALAAAAEGRSRLVSEIRNVLDVMRRGEGLRFEDVMVFDPSVFFGMADIHDQHRDMRLDVDNMSYEELLALEERIGNVCTGLSEETIVSRMEQRKYVHTMSDDQTEPEPCCICQEEYKEGEDLGTLDCGHDFHSDCIRKWLSQKNLCPICKTTGLAT